MHVGCKFARYCTLVAVHRYWFAGAGFFRLRVSAQRALQYCGDKRTDVWSAQAPDEGVDREGERWFSRDDVVEVERVALNVLAWSSLGPNALRVAFRLDGRQSQGVAGFDALNPA